MDRAALSRRLTWQLATAVGLIDETARCKSLVLDPPSWPVHRAGQHVDLRLTAEDGYEAERSYSIGSAPGDSKLVLTVERLEDGEVSPYLTDELRPGDELELRGPIGGYFVWEQSFEGPLVTMPVARGRPLPRDGARLGGRKPGVSGEAFVLIEDVGRRDLPP